MVRKEHLDITRIDGSRVGALALPLAAAALLLAACGAQDRDTSGLPNPGTSVTGSATPPSTQEHRAPTLTFDYLGGNSRIIQVYPGVGNTQADKISNGTFYDGNQVEAECKVTGRNVHSVPPETPRESDKWVSIHGTPGFSQFATAVYVQNPEALLAELSPC